ncbi:hypothetical protein CVT24_011711 [Panaeolus cyanescens]|uniref:Uncharacterized protein n=1 Tax=Panaeolus cyanescens TaxID=181874 RepID=A0A409YH69_9AGAR|nr:hypothetical protein CVT24_011711 [Panaeolus cyanescens]
MDDTPMGDDTQTQTAPLQPFAQTFQPFQSTNVFGWGQAATQSQPQAQIQPTTNTFSFLPQPTPAQLPQFSDPNEAAAYSFWFTMLAKIREQERYDQWQQLPVTTAPPQFSQPLRPFTPMFDLPSQPDGRPLVQRFSDDPPSPRFGGLRAHRSRRMENRGFDPFHIGSGMRPLAPSSATEGDIRVRGSEANLIHRLALEKRLEEEAKQRAAKERQVTEQAALAVIKDHEKKRKVTVRKRRRSSSGRRSTGDSPRKSKLDQPLTPIDNPATEITITASVIPTIHTQTIVSSEEKVQDTTGRRMKRHVFCPTFSMAIQRFLRSC